MFNREKEKSPKQKDARVQKNQTSKSLLGRNKINIRRCNSNQSLLRSQTLRDNKQDCSSLVKITPDSLHFQSIEQNKTYEMAFFIRNESSEIQKVRIIPPVKKQFKIKYNEDFNSEIASGLTVKILVIFHSSKQFQQFQDKIFVMGNSFKHEVALLAESPKANFSFTKYLNVGTLIVRQQRTIQIPIKNIGTKEGSISVEDIISKEYCPNISYENRTLIIHPDKTQILQISVEPIALGSLELKVRLSNLDFFVVCGIVVEEQVEIIEENGSKVTAKDFGELFVGQKVNWHFFVSNGTQNPVDCILQTLNQKRENADVKVDKKRNIFISQSSPQQFSASVQSSSFTLQKTSLKIKPFESFKNTLYVQKHPSNEQIEAFTQNLTKNIQRTIYKAQHALQIHKILNKSQNSNDMDKMLTGRSNISAFQNNSIQKISQKDKLINQTLAIKFSNQQKILKIPIKFLSKIPNLQIDINLLQFSKIYIKQTEVKQFVLKNYSSKKVKLTFDLSPSLKDNFKIQGPQVLEALSETIFKIKFRPLIKKKFAQILKILVFESFPIEIKIFGQCIGLDTNLLRNQMNFTMTDRKSGTKNGNWKSLLKDNTDRFTNQSFNQTLQKTEESLSNSKKTRSLNSLLINPLKLNKKKRLERSEDDQIAKVLFNSRQQNMSDQKQFKQGLFFKKQDFLTSIQRKKPFDHMKNVKQMLKYETLSLEELKKIEVSDKKLQFGHVFIGSQISKKLTIKNRLQSQILFQLDTLDTQSLKQNSQQGIKIEGCATYEVEIVLNPKELGDLQLSLNYIINREHVFEIKVLATVTLVNLQLSSKSFEFNLQQDDPSFQKQESLQVYNNGNKKTNFSFEPPKNLSFKLSTLHGELQPKSSMTIKIIYAPYFGGETGEQKIDVQKIKLKVHQGAQNVIKCTGSVKEPKITIKQTQFKYQNSIISVPITSKILIKNFSKVQTYIKIDFQSLNPKQKKQEFRSFFTSESQVYTLNGDEKKEIAFTFLCHQIRKIDANIILFIRGYKILKIPFCVNLIYPEIATLTPQIDFHEVPIMGNYCIEMFSLINVTPTQIKLQLDPVFPKDQYFCEILPVSHQNLETNNDDEKLKTFLSTLSVVFKENKNLSKRKSIISNKVLILPPNGSQSVFNVKFVPKFIKQYDVQMPLRLYGTVDKIVKPVNLQIKCNAVEPEIYVEPRSIRFDSKVINEAKTSYSQSLYISNRHDEVVKFKISSLAKNSQISSRRQQTSMLSAFNERFRRQELASTNSIAGTENFVFSQFEGEIQAQGKIQIFIIFRCIIEGEFFQKFSISLIQKGEGEQQIKPSATALSTYVLDVSGSSIMPTLKFNCNEAIMPVVPLNLQSRIFIMIENHGYDAITICKWKTSNHFPHTDIKVNFVEGKLLSLAKKSLRIEILFSSLAPISFTTMLELYDEFGNKYELPLSCTADNSIFTTFPYLESESPYTILFNNDEKMIKVISTAKNPYYEHNKQITGIHAMSCSFIQKWLNFQINLSIDSYPKSVIQSDGSEFVKIINRIASKNIIKKFELVESQSQREDDKSFEAFLNESKATISKAKVSKVLQLIELYSDTIRRLKQEGAFLNHIRPQFLLSYYQYVSYQSYKQKLVISQAAFEVLSVESWVCLFYQLCKIYIEPQINDRILTKMKVENGVVSMNITSNLYSNVEIMLIKFVNFYLSNQEIKTKNQSNMVVSFGEQIKIFEVIQRVLESNFNLSLSQQLNSLKSSVSTMSPHVFLSTIAKFLHTQLKQYGLSAYLGPTDLFSIGVKQLILYLINLVQMIYHYSNSNYVKFEGAVGDKITKVIELQNPTNKKVSYFVKIINNESLFLQKDIIKNSKGLENQIKPITNQSNPKPKQSSFIPEKNQVTIEPRQKSELKVVYHCKNAKGQTSNLYLIPSKQDDDSTLPQPLLFKLTTTILSKIIMKKIILSTPLYEVLPIHLDVELPSQIPQTAQFTLSLFQQTPKQDSQNSASFNFPSFIFSQSHVRTLKEGNKDSLELKLVPLNVGEKICRISYFSPIYGEFIYEIYVKVTNPKILKQIKIKDLKVSIEQEITVTISKQNDLLYGLAKIYYPDLYNFHMRTEKHLPNQGTKRNIGSSSKLNFSQIEKNSPKDLRYEVEILDSQFVSLARGSEIIEKLGQQNNIVLKAMFGKPFKEYPVILSVKNQLFKDKRLYKLIFAAISPPKIIKMQFKTTARQQIVQKIPIKLTPCDVSLRNNCQFFSIQSLQREYYTNTEVICHFNPKWILDKDATLEIQNKDSLEQLIYEISLKAEEPQSFGTYELIGSSLFNQEVSIPVDVQAVFLQFGQDNKTMFENKPFMANNYAKSIYFQVKRLFKRQHCIDSEQFYPFLNFKSLKSQTGIYTKSAQNPIKSEKQPGDKQKNSKTRSMINDKNIKSINLTLYPSQTDTETGIIRLMKPFTQEYYWAKVSIKNRTVEKLNQILLEEKINMTKVECLQDVLSSYNIDFEATDFEFKFEKESKNLTFKFMEMDRKNSSSMKKYTFTNYAHRQRPVLVFCPCKETQSQNIFYFKANNKEYMLPINLKAQPLPTIVVPEITTINTEPKLTYLNLLNGTEQTGTYKVKIIGQNQFDKLQCFKFIDDEKNQKLIEKLNISAVIKQKKTQDLIYYLKPKEKKQIRIAFAPKFIYQKQKLIIKFESQTLPNYTYILNGRSQFKIQQEKDEFQVYENHIQPFHIKFTNLFQKKQYFTIDLEPLEQEKSTKIEQYIKIEEPANKKFNLEEGEIKIILISLPEEYFKLSFEEMKANTNLQNLDPSGLKLIVNIRVCDKVVKRYELNLLIIKNLFSTHQKDSYEEAQFIQKIREPQKKTQTHEKKNSVQKYKNQFTWHCKARQTVYENIEIPQLLNFFVKQIKSPQQISKYLTFTCISQKEKSSHEIGKPQSNILKLKYSPMKPIKKKRYDLILIGIKGEKYRIECEISVDDPPIDDTIVIKTSQIDQVGCVSFKLTNITKLPAKYKGYFMKKLPQFSLQVQNGILEGYGKPGTAIVVKFKSHINNRRLQDKLILETEDMYWCFKVKGMLSKD